MRTLISVVIMLLVVVGSVSAQQVTQRVDCQDGKEAVETTYLQGLPGGVEVWVLGENTPAPTYRLGMVRPVASDTKIGAYLNATPETGKLSFNPRAVRFGEVAGGNGVAVIDAYIPLNDRSKASLSFSDLYVTWEVTEEVSLGFGWNGTLTGGQGLSGKGCLVGKAKISKNIGAYARWNCFGGGPDSLRGEVSLKF